MFDDMGTVWQLVGVNGGIGVALFLTLRWILERSVTAKLDVLRQREIEEIKHGLKVDFEKSTLVLNSQKESYRNVLKALHGTIRKLEPADAHDWNYLYKTDVDTLKAVIAEESLFVPRACHAALSLFVEAVQELEYDEGYAPPEPDLIEKRYGDLVEIAERVADSFKWQIGILDGDDPLRDIGEIRERILGGPP